MDLKSVLSKTSKGREEIETRKHKLDQRMRRLLIMVNGKLTAGELIAQLGNASGIAPLLDQLQGDGFVEPSVDPAQRLKQATRALSSAISAALGPMGDDIAIGIEAAKSLDDLHSFLESQRATLDRMLGKRKGPPFWNKVSTLL